MALPGICRPWHPAYKWGSRFLCLAIFLLQALTLDYYLVYYLAPMWGSWAIIDVLCLGMFVATLALSSHRAVTVDGPLRRFRQSHVIGLGELPLGYIAWALYAVQTSVRTAILFHYVAGQLEEKNFFGPNTMRTAMALTAVVFLELVLAHHDTPRKKCIHEYINDVAGSTALDILDAVAILDVLYDARARDSLDIHMRNTVVVVSSVNILLPTIPLFVLSRGHFEEQRTYVAVYMSYRLLHVLLGDVALLTMRMFLWHVKDERISVFVIKNCISIGMTLKQVYEMFVSEDEDDKNGQDQGQSRGADEGAKDKVDGDEEAGLGEATRLAGTDDVAVVVPGEDAKDKGKEGAGSVLRDLLRKPLSNQNRRSGSSRKYRTSTMGFDAAHS